MAHPSPLPTDHDVRELVVTDLASTLFVEAGAGSGKTTVLVDRVCALVESGIDVRKIAAITFTEKAAAELRSRVREVLTSRETEAGDAARQSSAKRPCRRSTHSLVGCSRSTGSRSECLRGSRCATRWVRRSTSKRIGVSSPRSCSTRKAHWPRSWCGPSSSASSPATSERSCSRCIAATTASARVTASGCGRPRRPRSRPSTCRRSSSACRR